MNFITRAQWGARSARSSSGLNPSYGTTIHYEGPRMGTFPHSSCASKVRGIQNYHMDAKQWQDGAYTAIVCPHGYVYELRWVGRRTAANGTNPGNNSAYAVCALIGQGDEMPAVMVQAIAEVCSWLRTNGRSGGRVNGHRDWKSTACPGDPLYSQVRSGRFVGSVVTTPPSTPTGGKLATVQYRDGTWREGDQGEAFRWVQVMFNITRRYHKAEELAVDGKFGPASRRVVVAFQKFARDMGKFAGHPESKLIKVDGIAGPQTMGANGFWVRNALK